jgi:hypothetical protein
MTQSNVMMRILIIIKYGTRLAQVGHSWLIGQDGQDGHVGQVTFSQVGQSWHVGQVVFSQVGQSGQVVFSQVGQVVFSQAGHVGQFWHGGQSGHFSQVGHDWGGGHTGHD